MQSIDIFNLATLEIFRRCLVSFPVPVKLDAFEIGLEVESFFTAPETAEELFVHSAEIQARCRETMNWLNNEGFLSVVHKPTSGPIIATLTQKGIVATNANFDSLDKGKKFSDFMTSSAKDITKNVVSTLVAGLFAYGS